MDTTNHFEILVVGGGHAGVEAALMCARLNHKTALITLSKENIAKMPCNPSIGGPAKGIVVREIDALGGQMGITADKTAIQVKMLNTAKGPGVQSLRVQSDKVAYSKMMQEIVLEQENLELIEKQVEKILVENNKIIGVKCSDNTVIKSKITILTTGTYMSSHVMISDQINKTGPDGEETTFKLSQSLRDEGLTTFRLKTGTPARVFTESIDFTKTEPQPGSPFFASFSTLTKNVLPLEKQALCYLTYTNQNTHEIIHKNLDKSSMYSGVVKGVGPRYCPSIEDKLVRFFDKERHQLFLEPESLSMDTTYVQGLSSSLPKDVQEDMIHSIAGLEEAKIKIYAYAIEYDAIDPLQLKPTLETKIIENCFTAGQINGTSGYEEAAAQGLMAAINAVLKLENRGEFILRRDEAYIGVMIDDLVTKGTNEPYRLLTSRAEFRLLLRHDNADQRLTGKAYDLGLPVKQRYEIMCKKLEEMGKLKEAMKETRYTMKSEVNEYLKTIEYDCLSEGISAYDLLKRPRVECYKLKPYLGFEFSQEVARQVEIECKYQGYIDKAKKEAAKLEHMDKVLIPKDLNFDKIEHISLEAKQKLVKVQPVTLGQASRISGVNPADIAVLAMIIEQNRKGRN